MYSFYEYVRIFIIYLYYTQSEIESEILCFLTVKSSFEFCRTFCMMGQRVNSFCNKSFITLCNKKPKPLGVSVLFIFLQSLLYLKHNFFIRKLHVFF